MHPSTRQTAPSKQALSSRGRATALTILVALAAACSTGPAPTDAHDTVDVEVRPVEEVLASDIVVTPDPSGTSATLTVTTSVPLACSVAYGPDETLGSIATDGDMAGGAHTDHAPVLAGLTPETEYRYVLQGADASGTLYRSQVLTFTTPAATAPERPGDDVASTGRVTGASSAFSAAFAPEHAIDGDPLTEWSSAGDGDDAWIEIELPEPTEVVGVALLSRSMGDGSAIITSYEVTVDDDVRLGPFDASDDTPMVAEVEVVGTRFRFDAVTTTGGNTGAAVIEILARR